MAESPAQPPNGEDAHDVLAAEAFAVPAPDPELRHGPVVLPDDPTGIPEPHDVLAAEEFPMPSGGRPHASGQTSRSRAARRGAMLAAVGLLAWLFVRRRRA
jgi:hypothetical protein